MYILIFQESFNQKPNSLLYNMHAVVTNKVSSESSKLKTHIWFYSAMYYASF